MSTLYRHEQKYICSTAQIKHLRKVLTALLPEDLHQNGSYHVKSLYFDTIDNRFFQESLNGVAKRSKYRLRRYNNEKNVKLECKQSLFGLKQKRFVWLSPAELASVFQNSSEISDNPLLNEFYCLKKTEFLRPKIIIDYDRSAFVLQNLNVRITLDQKITSSQDVNLFLDSHISGKNILPQDSGILEVKFDDILPTYISQILGLEDLEQATFSKYMMGCLAHQKND